MLSIATKTTANTGIVRWFLHRLSILSFITFRLVLLFKLSSCCLSPSIHQSIHRYKHTNPKEHYFGIATSVAMAFQQIAFPTIFSAAVIVSIIFFRSFFTSTVIIAVGNVITEGWNRANTIRQETPSHRWDIWRTCMLQSHFAWYWNWYFAWNENG